MTAGSTSPPPTACVREREEGRPPHTPHATQTERSFPFFFSFRERTQNHMRPVCHHLATLPFIAFTFAQAANAQHTGVWQPTSVQDLHREYGNIFKVGNRNAASHLWATFVLDRSEHLTPSSIEMVFSGFCAVSGSPTRPGDYTRYRLRLPLVNGGTRLGFMYYCAFREANPML